MGRNDKHGKKMTSFSRSPVWWRLPDVVFVSLPHSYLRQQAPGWQTVYVWTCTYICTIGVLWTLCFLNLECKGVGKCRIASFLMHSPGRMCFCFLPWESLVQSGEEGYDSGLERARRNNQTLWGQTAFLARELQAVPQPALPAYSNIYNHFLAGESNWTSICYLANESLAALSGLRERPSCCSFLTLC